MGANMNSRMRFFLPPLAALWLVPSVHASNLAYVKCAANQDRVWVYDSLSSFDVETKLRCGAPVEILLRIKDYVKIRTESGEEGYVPDTAFPDLPALPDETKQPLATAAAHSTAALHNPARTVNTLNSDTASSAAPKPIVSAETAAKPEPPAAPVPQPAVTASAPAVPAAVAQVKAVAPEKQGLRASRVQRLSLGRRRREPLARLRSRQVAAPGRPVALVSLPSRLKRLAWARRKMLYRNLAYLPFARDCEAQRLNGRRP